MFNWLWRLFGWDGGAGSIPHLPARCVYRVPPLTQRYAAGRLTTRYAVPPLTRVYGGTAVACTTDECDGLDRDAVVGEHVRTEEDAYGLGVDYSDVDAFTDADPIVAASSTVTSSDSAMTVGSPVYASGVLSATVSGGDPGEATLKFKAVSAGGVTVTRLLTVLTLEV